MKNITIVLLLFSLTNAQALLADTYNYYTESGTPIQNIRLYKLESGGAVIIKRVREESPVEGLLKPVIHLRSNDQDHHSSWTEQRELSLNYYSPPTFTEGEQKIFAQSLSSLFVSHNDLSPDQAIERSQSQEAAIKFDIAQRYIKNSSKILINYSKEIEKSLKDIRKLSKHIILQHEEIKRIERHNYSPEQKRALKNLVKVKLDTNNYKGPNAHKFNLVREKFWNISANHLVAPQSYAFLDMASTSYQAAKDSYHKGNDTESEGLLEISNAFLNVALGYTPFVGIFKAAYEAFSGTNLVTGKILSREERWEAAFTFAFSLTTTTWASKYFMRKLFPYAKNILKDSSNYITLARKFGLKSIDEMKDFYQYTRSVFKNNFNPLENLQKFNIRKITSFNASNLGPLSKIPGGAYIISTFKDYNYYETVNDSPLKLYRIYSNDETNLGPFWTRIKPQIPLILDKSQTKKSWVEITIPEGSIMYEGFKKAAQSSDLLYRPVDVGQVVITDEIPESYITDQGSL